MSTALETVREIYDAFNRGDVHLVTALLADDIEWIEPAGYFVPDGRGRTNGRDAVMAVFAQYADFWESFRAEPDTFFDTGDGEILVLGRQIGVGRRSGTPFTGEFANYWRVADGRAVLHRSFSDTKSVADAIA